MNGLAEDMVAEGVNMNAGIVGGGEAGPEGASRSEHIPSGESVQSSDAALPDLRWLGMISCMCSAAITLVGAALVAGQLLSAGTGDMVAEDEGALPDYAVAAGSDN